MSNEERNQQIIDLSAAMKDYENWVADNFGWDAADRIAAKNNKRLDALLGTTWFSTKPLSLDYWQFNAELGTLNV